MLKEEADGRFQPKRNTYQLPKRFARKQTQIFLDRVSEGMSIKADHFVLIAKRSIQDNKLQFERQNQIESWKMYKSQIEIFGLIFA